jgi:hypothetical protein
MNAYDTSPANELVSITPSDSTVFSPHLRAVYVGVGGNIAIRVPGSNTAVTLIGVPQGTILPIKVERLMATSTTASSLVGLR